MANLKYIRSCVREMKIDCKPIIICEPLSYCNPDRLCVFIGDKK